MSQHIVDDKWLGVKSVLLAPVSSRENDHIEPSNGKTREELLNREVFTILMEAQVLESYAKVGDEDGG